MEMDKAVELDEERYLKGNHSFPNYSFIERDKDH